MNALPPRVRITMENFKDVSLSKQKWDFGIKPRQKHRAFYGSFLDCELGRNCQNEPFYQVKWASYKKTGKMAWAYGMKQNYKWACPVCAGKWLEKNQEKMLICELPELPAYINPALEHGPFNGPISVYDGRFC